MVEFTLSALGWLGSALLRFFVITGTSYGIYKLIKDKIDDKRRDRYLESCKERHEREMDEAMGVAPERTKEEIQEDRQIKAETTYIAIVCSIVLLIIILIAIFK